MSRRQSLAVDLGLVAVSLLCGAIYLSKGVGFVLDDWYYLRNADLDGVLHAAGSTGGDRPVGALVYVLFFGVVGEHPGLIVVLLALINGATAVLMRRLLVRWLSEPVSIVVAALWIVLPLRTSLEIWMSTGTAALAQLLAVAGVLLIAVPAPSRARSVVAIGLIVAATLSYESTAVLAVPVALGARLAISRRFERMLLAAIVIFPAIALGWAFTHRLPGRRAIGGIRDPLPVIDANFGRGIAPTAALAVLTTCVAVVGSILVLRAWRHVPGKQRWMIVVGWLVTAGGVVPYLTYFYSPYGAGDRLNMLSAFGAVLIWAGLVKIAVDRRPLAGLVGLTLLVGIGLAARWERSELWSRAGLDAERVVADIVRLHPHPERPILVGPAPIVVEGIAAFYDHSNIAAALELAYGAREIDAYMALGEEEFEQAHPQRFLKYDQRAVSTLDDVGR